MSIAETISSALSGKRSGKGFRERTTNHFMRILRKIQYRLCHLLCKDQVFNSDMSLEIDRLIIENDSLTLENQRLREQLNER